MNEEKLRGNVVWFNEQKGYGFLTVDGEDKQVFVHYSGIVKKDSQKFRTLAQGARVEFVVRRGPKGPQAEEVVEL